MGEDAPARPVRCARTLAVRRQPGADLTTAELQQPIARRVLEIEGYASVVCVMDESPLADNLDASAQIELPSGGALGPGHRSWSTARPCLPC
jgi:hypothetical protein